MRLCVFVLCVCAVAWGAAASRTFLVTCPLSLRLDATEKVLVQLFGYDSDQTVYLLLKSSMSADGVEYDKVPVQLTASNNYQNTASVRISPKELVEGASHVILHVQSAGGINQHERIPISRTNGYLFVQTDKPLYTPQQSVKVRAFSLNEELRPANRSVFLKFMDPDHQEVDKVEMTDYNNGIPSLQNPFKLPLEPKFGVWTIHASYSPQFSTVAKTDFEVKEYVLPSMSIQLVPETTYISDDNFEQFSFTIIATYNNGAPVRNSEVYCRYGYVSGKNKPTIIPNSVTLYRLQSEGTTTVTVNIKRILARHDGPKDLDGLRGKYLYVAVLLKENTGGISQEAELASVKFVKSPYSLSLVATPPFIKPGLPYTIQVSVKDHLGTPVSGVPVKMEEGVLSCPSSSSKDSNSDGLAVFICNTRKTDRRDTLKFVTANPRLPLTSQAHLSVAVSAYSSPNERYIYIDSPMGHLDVGHQAYIHVYTAMPSYVPVQSINYMIMSKGKLVHFGQNVFRASIGTRQTSVSFRVTSAMSPSIRLLVYYIAYAEGTAELVADSVWINVVDKCVNGLKTSLRSREQQYGPNGNLQLEISANQNGLVALSAVDTALYSLRHQQKNPLNQVLRHIEKSDQGCGGGGGRNNADVFRLAGLTFITNANAQALPSGDPCTAAVRPKRALTEEQKEEKVNSFPEPFREYCRKGMEYSPKVVTCAKYAEQLLPKWKYRPIYRKVYTHCCEFLQENLSSRDELQSARSELGPDLDNVPTLVRSFFPESWLWEVQRASTGTVSLSRTLPHSLTTWEFQAVGIFPNGGICVADPIRVPVSQPVSIDVPLPYKLVRGEQLELKGSVYNQEHNGLRYCVTLTVGPALCVLDSQPSSTPGLRSTLCPDRSRWPTLAGESVAAVKFFLMALEPGEHTLTFTLKTQERGVLDILQKKLRVVPEGVRTEMFSGGRLDPQGLYGSEKIKVILKNKLPLNQVPHTDVERELIIHGEILGEIMSVMDNPEGLLRLVNLPPGSAEADLAGLFPLVYVYKYLETTGRWGILGADVQKKSQELRRKIKEGLVGISSFRSQSTASYSMWPGREPSTWLTALVVNALAQTDSVEPVGHDSLQQTLKWLISTAQNPDGSFKEFSHYSPNKIMSKNATLLDQSVYLTSFVLIGLHKATQIDDPKLRLKSQEDSKTRAAGYLSQHAMQVQSVYVRAVACYAMTLHDPNSQTATELYNSLERLAKEKGHPAVLRYWQERDVTADWVKPDASSALTVATTAYVLLTSLAKGRISYANPILSWLTQDQHHGGAVYSAQDTALTLQAVTEYSSVVRSAPLNQHILVKYKRKGNLKSNIHLTQTQPVASPIQVTIDDSIEASTGYGTGVSHIKLKTVFYQTVATNENCKFDTSIQPSKADATNDSPRIEACVKYKPAPNEIPVASSTVMEIQLPSGIQPFMEDLRPFRDGDEPVVSSYKLQGDILTIQMDAVPTDMFLCVGFRIREEFRVGATSESTFRVYELQDSKGSECTKQYSYSVQKLHRLCVAEQCQCMSVSCATYRGSAGGISMEDHIRETCEPHIKYAYRVVVNSQTTEGDFIIYTATVEQVLKSPAKEFALLAKGVDIDLIKKVTCSSVDLQLNSQYLIMGTNGKEYTLSDRFGYRFPLDSEALVELWPAADCRDPSCGEHRALLDDFSMELLLDGCP